MKISFLRLAAPWFLVILGALLSRAIFVLVPALPPLSEIVDAGDIIVVAGNHENQTITGLSTALPALLSLACSIAQDVIDLAKA